MRECEWQYDRDYVEKIFNVAQTVLYGNVSQCILGAFGTQRTCTIDFLYQISGTFYVFVVWNSVGSELRKQTGGEIWPGDGEAVSVVTKK